MKALVFTAVLVLVGIGAQAKAADKDDGNELLNQCQAVERFADGQSARGWEEESNFYTCLGYLEGVIDGITVMSSIASAQSPWCPPAGGVQASQVARIVVKYLRDHPEDLHLRGAVLTTVALAEAFPCASRKTSRADKL